MVGWGFSVSLRISLSQTKVIHKGGGSGGWVWGFFLKYKYRFKPVNEGGIH